MRPELRQLIDGCHEESWQASEPTPETRATSVTDFRVRKSIKLMSESPGAELELDSVERGGRVVGMRAPEIGGGP